MKNYEEILKEFYEENESEITMNFEEYCDHCYMMTQYEQGCIDFEGYLRDVFNENYDVEDYFSYYSEYDNTSGIYNMEDVEWLFEGQDVHYILCRVYYGDFCPAHNYFKFDGYGNLKSSDYIDELIDDKEGFIDYLIENDEEYNLDTITDVKANEDLLKEGCRILVENGF